MGMPLDEFWRLTPWLFAKKVDGFIDRIRHEHDENAYTAWHTAMWSRAKKMPSFKEVVRRVSSKRKKEVKHFSEGDILARFKLIKKRVEDGNGSQVKC